MVYSINTCALTRSVGDKSMFLFLLTMSESYSIVTIGCMIAVRTSAQNVRATEYNLHTARYIAAHSRLHRRLCSTTKEYSA